MLSFEATTYAMKFASAHESDELYIKENDFNGLLTAFQEEMGECIAAIGKYKRTQGEGPITLIPEDKAKDNMIEELADVLSTGILLAQKMGWIDECLERHTTKSKMCAERIRKKESQDGEA